MASTSTSRAGGVAGRIRTATGALYEDNQSLVTDIRKALGIMKEVVIDLERDNQSQMVKELEDAVVELLEASQSCTQFSTALQSVGNGYVPGEELTDFKKLFDDEVAKVKGNSSSLRREQPFLRQFREAVWNVHHAGQPMPGEEQEDIIMTSTQCSLLNLNCPLSGKPITELSDPVRSADCKHIYDKTSIMLYIRSKNGQAQCPAAGCPKVLVAERVACDPLLCIEIDEMRSTKKETATPEMVEDFTELEDEESS